MNLNELCEKIKEICENKCLIDMSKSIVPAGIQKRDPILQMVPVKHKDNVKVIAFGAIVDISTSKTDGTTLLVIIRYGKVQIGDYFSAGGWSGYVKRIIHDNSSVWEAAGGGCGVKLVVKLDDDIADPSPLGDTVIFYGKSSEIAQSFADFARMEFAFGKSNVCVLVVTHALIRTHILLY